VCADDKNYYFLFYGLDGKSEFYSRGYSGKSGRDNGMKTVIRNANMSDQHEIKEEKGKYYFILKAGNRQGIARSAFYNSKQEAEK
jgi:uncharacterized protein YegP (UPF0339 family)